MPGVAAFSDRSPVRAIPISNGSRRHWHQPAPTVSADVNRAMTQLKPNERAMLWMAYAEGATHPEIASVLGLNPASMKVLLFRARRKMAALLRGEKR